MIDGKLETETPLTESVATGWRATDTLVVGSIPVLGYWFAYLYERGFCEELGIPSQFINLNSTAIFGRVAFLATFVYAGVLWANLLLGVRLGAFFRVFLLPSILTLLFTLVSSYGKIDRWIGYLLVIVTLSSWLINGLALFFRRKAAISLRAAMGELDQNHSFGTIPRSVGPTWMFLIIGVLFLSVICTWFGRYEARTMRVFPTVNTDPNLAVLRVYNDTAICGTVNRASKELFPEFTFLKIGSDANLRFRLEEIGPLRLSHEVLNNVTIPPSARPISTTRQSSTLNK